MNLIHSNYDLKDTTFIRYALRYRRAMELLRSVPSLWSRCNAQEAAPASFDDYRSVHRDLYVDLLERVARTGQEEDSVHPGAVEFEQIGVGGTLSATRLAMSQRSPVYHLGGGYHHGWYDRPGSIDFCNDVAMALQLMITMGAQRILYLDLDAHFPDGVQRILGSEHRILQISLHAWHNHMTEGHYSFIGDAAARGKRINMPLPLFTGDAPYLAVVGALLKTVKKNYPCDAVFYQAGVDPYRMDPEGHLRLSLAALYERDRMVARFCEQSGVPFITVLGGGYHPVGGPQAIVNTIAALTGHPIVFNEPVATGATTGAKVVRWYGELAGALKSHIVLEPLELTEGGSGGT